MEAVQQQRKETADLQAGCQKKVLRSALLLKSFNLNIYKFHTLSDYDRMIRMFETTDLFTTPAVSCFTYIP